MLLSFWQEIKILYHLGVSDRWLRFRKMICKRRKKKTVAWKNVLKWRRKKEKFSFSNLFNLENLFSQIFFLQLRLLGGNFVSNGTAKKSSIFSQHRQSLFFFANSFVSNSPSQFKSKQHFKEKENWLKYCLWVCSWMLSWMSRVSTLIN